MSPHRRLRSLVADAGVRATATTRIIALVGAPVSIYLAATRLAPRAQGYYFVAVNVIALAQLFELGLGTIVVQFVSHEWPRLRWSAGGGLEGEPVALATVHLILRSARQWYATAALILSVVAGAGGVLLYGSMYSGSLGTFATAWCGFVALTALYLLIIPLIAVVEGCGGLVSVQHMRSGQALALLAALWAGILSGSPLTAACLGAAAQLAVAVTWLLTRHRVLLGTARAIPRHPTDSERGTGARVRTEQRQSARLWLALWLAPQLLTPIVLRFRGGDDAGRLGVSMAIALAPLSLALAWLHGRYPSFGALVSQGMVAEFDTLARRAAAEAVAVFLASAGAVVGGVLLLPLVLPAVAARVLPVWSVVALLGGALASLLLQAMAGWLRAFRDETLAGPIVGGAAATVIVSGMAAVVGGVQLTTTAFAAASLGIAVPLAAVHYVRVRRRRLS